MAERKARPVDAAISPEPETVREEQREREGAIERRSTPKATIDPKLVEQRAALIKQEDALKGRSLRDAPITR